MPNRRGFACAIWLFGGAAAACAGSFSEEPGPPWSPPAAAATAGAGGVGGQAMGGGAATPSLPGAGGETASGGAGTAMSMVPDEPGDPKDLPALPPIEFCDAPTKVLMASCGNGSCHSNANVYFGDFAVDTQRIYNFVDKVSVRNATCGKIIDSQDYSKSLLLTKVRGDFESPKCGERMPIGSFVITEEQIDCLASWLQQFQL